MNRHFIQHRIIPRDLLTSNGLLWRAALLTGVFLAGHLAGWREHTIFLSGTDPAAGSGHGQTIIGLIYVLSFLAFTLVAPIFILAAALRSIMDKGSEGERSEVSSDARSADDNGNDNGPRDGFPNR